MYQKLIDTVSAITTTYGVGILSDPRFWNILTDSYSFASDYSLRDTFKTCIADGYIAEIVSLKGNHKKTIDKINYVIAKVHKISTTKEDEYSAVLFSIAIAVGTCTKTDYKEYCKENIPRPSSPNNDLPSGNPSKLAAYSIVVLGIITQICGTLLYGWFLFGDAGLFWVICIIWLLQLGTLRILIEYIYKTTNDIKIKSRIINCFIPIIVGDIINSTIPLFLCSDSIADTVYTYFSSDFIPESYYHVILEDTTSRLSPEVGFWGGFASVVLWISLVSVGYTMIFEFYDSNKKNINEKLGFIITLIVSLSCYVAIGVWPTYNLHMQRDEYENITSRNIELRNNRENKVQELSVKGIKLGISSETAWEYMMDLKEDVEPEQLSYNKWIKHPDALYDEFIGTSYYDVFPYKIPPSDFVGVNLQGDDYRMPIHLDNTTVGLDLYIYDGLVSAIRIYGLSYNNSLTNFDSFLSLYTSKYGEPELIKNFSREKDIHKNPVRSKWRCDRYVWNFKNGRIEMTKFGIMYLSDKLLSIVTKECEDGLRELELAKRMKAEADRMQRERDDSLSRVQDKNDSIRKLYNHQNAINEI